MGSNRVTDPRGHLDASTRTYRMKISTEWSKFMINTTVSSKAEIRTNGVNLKKMGPLSVWGAIISRDGGCAEDVLLRIKAATAAMARLKQIRDSRSVGLYTKFRLYKYLIVPIMFYGCETWTLLKEQKRRIQAFEMKCFRKLIRIFYRRWVSRSVCLSSSSS